MRPLVVDVVVDLPVKLRELALSSSALLVERMRADGHPSTFQLGQRLVAEPAGGACEPHVSLFMLAIDERETGEVLDAVRSVAAGLPALPVEGAEYRHNPHGAPELYFHRSAAWVGLQRAVVAAVEPLRRGRLPETDPAGVPLAPLVGGLRRNEPDSERLRQLLRYGYDEIVDDHGDRFNPHVTLAWPADGFPVGLDGLTAATDFSGTATDLAVYGMRHHGTCTTRYGGFPLGGTIGDPDRRGHGG